MHKNGSLLTTPFARLEVSRDGERGLIGLALHPDFGSNHRVYVHYTTNEGGAHNRISRLTAAGDVASGETVVADLRLLGGSWNHNGGGIAFGPDGKLYVGVGENYQPSHAQSLGSVFGKVLRFNADGTIPTDNPYYATATGQNRAIWARGLRNPFTLAFDPARALLFINDVGQAAWEEINEGSRGANYGWPGSEGPVSSAGITPPRYAYPHDGAFISGFAIVGAAFYRPSSPSFGQEYVGDYFFGDFVNGWVGRLDPSHGDAVSIFATGLGHITSLAVGPDGSLYVAEGQEGSRKVTRISR